MKWFDSSTSVSGILLSSWVLAPIAFAARVGLLLWSKRHLFGMRLHERYRKEGIQIPFPIGTLDLPRAQVAQMRDILAGAAVDARRPGFPARPAEH
jgi:hypothetical protein